MPRRAGLICIIPAELFLAHLGLVASYQTEALCSTPTFTTILINRKPAVMPTSFDAIPSELWHRRHQPGGFPLSQEGTIPATQILSREQLLEEEAKRGNRLHSEHPYVEAGLGIAWEPDALERSEPACTRGYKMPPHAFILQSWLKTPPIKTRPEADWTELYFWSRNGQFLLRETACAQWMKKEHLVEAPVWTLAAAPLIRPSHAWQPKARYKWKGTVPAHPQTVSL